MRHETRRDAQRFLNELNYQGGGGYITRTVSIAACDAMIRDMLASEVRQRKQLKEWKAVLRLIAYQNEAGALGSRLDMPEYARGTLSKSKATRRKRAK
jgi:hypothetical protein